MIKKILLPILLLVSVVSFGQVPAYVPSNGLVGWWGFNGNANDESGNGNNGTVNGATLTTDRFGNPNSAFDFNGQGDYISVNDNSHLRFSSHTISLWYYRYGNPLVQTGVCGNTGIEFLISKGQDIANNAITIAQSNDYGQIYQIPPTQVAANYSLGAWNNIICTYDSISSSAKLYLNGILTSSMNNVSWNCFSNISNLTFGVHSEFINTTCTYYYKGMLDDIGIWNRALTQCEISELYHAQQFTPPVLAVSDTTSACGATTTLDAGTDPAWASYLWNTTEDTQTISVSNAGLYTIAVTDTNGCVGYDTTLVSIIDPTIDQIDTNICIGDSLVLSVDTISGNSCIGLPVNLQDSLVAYYPFCGNAIDESDNGNDGTVNGATLTSDRFGNLNSAYDFDGNDWIEPGTIVYGNSFTISYWIEINSFNSYSSGQIGGRVISSFTNSTAFPNNWESGLHASSGVLSVGNGTQSCPTPYQLNLNTWYHVNIVFDGIVDSIRLLINGSQACSNFFNYSNTGNTTVIGGRSNSPANFFFNGKIDDITIHNRALTESEIQQLYQLGNYDITWSTGDTTSSITVQPTTTTTYTVTVDDGISSCTDDVTITVNDPQVTAGADQTICNGDAVTLSGAGASTYTWDNSVTDGVAISPTATADYIVTGTDTLGCVAEDTTTITVNPLPTVDAGTFQQICDGDTVTLSGTGAATYAWDNGQTDGTEFTPTTTTLYTVIGTDANGCIDSDTVSIGVWSLPLVDAGADQTICDEDLVTLSGSGASTYSWDNSVVDGVGFSPSATTTYTLTGTDANGCSDLAYVTVTVNPLPAVDAGAAQIVCTGTPVTLSATGAVSYTWNNGVTDGVAFTPTNTLLYEVIGTDANSCEATDTVTVTVVAELTVLAGTDQTVCEGTSVTLSGSGANTYTWTGGITNAIPFTASSTTIYVVTGSDGNNCADTDSVTVNVNPTPDLSSVTTNVSLGMDGEIDLSVTNGTPPYLYDWDNDGIGDFDDPEDLSALDAGTYSVIVTDDFGCSDTLMVIITEDLQIFISTVITPNGDGMNDTWGVTGLSTDAKVQVLNRWGQVLYNTTGYSIPWDGTNNGETLPASDYYYIIDLGQGDVRTGTITLKY